MYNKKVVVLLGVFASICLNFLGLFSSAISLKLDLSAWNILEPEIFKKRISPIHFKDHGNDFGGLIYFEQGSGESLGDPEAISVSGDATNTVYNCRQPVEGFYYNEERGERLWPLDRKTADLWSMNDLNLSGGIYTRCILSGREAALEDCAVDESLTQEQREQCEKDVKNKYRDKYGYYGFIEHTYSGQNMKLVIGTDYKSGSDRVVLSGSLEPSLIRIRNTFPVGFVYDNNGGVGFVGCEVVSGFENILSKYNNGNKDWNNYFSVNDGLTGLKVIDSNMIDLVACDERVGSAKDTLLSIVVEGIVGMSKNSNTDGYVGNQSNEKMQLFSSVDVNNTTLINYAKQKAESLCRGKWILEGSSLLPTADDIVCLEKNDGFIDASNSIYSGKTLIVKGGANVKIKPDKDKVYDIFVDSGNLLIEESEHDIQYVIKKNGFISNGVFPSTGDFMDYAVFLFSRADNVSRAGVNSLIGEYLIGGSPGVTCNDLLDPLEKGACKFVDGIEEISIGDGYLSAEEWNQFDDFVLGDIDLKNYFDESSVSSVINGNFIINGKVVGTGLSSDGVLKNKYFIYGKFTTRDSFGDLERVFSWRCGSNGVDTNSNPCLPFEGVPNSYASLSIIDQNYNSPLFK